jgi:hypothetical protein
MKLLLAYVAIVVFVGFRTARRADRDLPIWHVLVPAVVVALGFLSQRML